MGCGEGAVGSVEKMGAGVCSFVGLGVGHLLEREPSLPVNIKSVTAYSWGTQQSTWEKASAAWKAEVKSATLEMSQGERS